MDFVQRTGETQKGRPLNTFVIYRESDDGRDLGLPRLPSHTNTHHSHFLVLFRDT